MDTPPSNGWLEAWHAALAILGAGGVWAWNFVTGDIRKLREESVTKVTFAEYSEHAQKQRDELRESIIKLYDGQTALTKQMNDQHVATLNAIHEVKK